MIGLISVNTHRTEREVQNAAVILFAAHHLDGPVRGCGGRNAGARQSQGVTEDSTMTEDENGLNRRKALDIRTGWLVEAHMALICGKVITWFIGCRL
ncbi:MAG: hypothetical protein WB540_05400 [Pseudolabrys sp.]|jgi:hypothetical protein